jgi:hypothetical protein
LRDINESIIGGAGGGVAKAIGAAPPGVAAKIQSFWCESAATGGGGVGGGLRKAGAADAGGTFHRRSERRMLRVLNDRIAWNIAWETEKVVEIPVFFAIL